MTQSIVRCLLGLALGAATLQAQTAGHEPRIARIEQSIRPVPIVRGNATTIEERMKALRIPGISVAVVDSGRVVWAKAYGVADTVSKRPVTTNTRFQAASMSKPVGSMAALRLVQDGRLSLDADINSQLKSWQLPPSGRAEWKPVTLRMLLTHTAGLTVHGFPGYERSRPLPTVQQILDGATPANTARVRIDTAPGTIWRYSGGGMTVAQLLMEEASGEAFPAVVRRLVLAPAGMTASTYEQPLPDSLHQHAAWGYRPDVSVVPGNWHNYPEMMAAGLWTTPTDLGRWIIELQRAYAGTSSRILNQTMARAMLTPGLGNWGLGVQMIGAGDSLRFGHGGSNMGFKGQFIGYVNSGRGVVVMANGDRGAILASEILAAVGREYDWPGMRELRERVEIPIDGKLLDRYLGQYQLRPDFIITVRRGTTDQQLIAQASGPSQGPITLFPEGPREFFSKVTDIAVRFETDATGTATTLVLTQNGATTRAPRIP